MRYTVHDVILFVYVFFIYKKRNIKVENIFYNFAIDMLAIKIELAASSVRMYLSVKSIKTVKSVISRDYDDSEMKKKQRLTFHVQIVVMTPLP